MQKNPHRLLQTFLKHKILLATCLLALFHPPMVFAKVARPKSNASLTPSFDFHKAPHNPLFHPSRFALLTIPKSGSHLLIKTLYFMTGMTPTWHLAPPQIEELFQENHFPYTHCCLRGELFQYYSHSYIPRILGIRDLRDVCVSIVYQIRKGTWPEFTGNKPNQKWFKELSFDDQLLFVINQEYEINPPKIELQLGIQKVANQAISLMEDPLCLICRYEDLVGPNGGGSLDAQKAILTKIAEHLGGNLLPFQLDELISQLYGNQENPFGQGDFSRYQSTFREGKIGSWKSAFKPIHKKAFKARLGNQLIALGYEQDNNW